MWVVRVVRQNLLVMNDVNLNDCTVLEFLRSVPKTNVLVSFCESIDSLLGSGNGLLARQTVELVGETGAGKVCLLLAVSFFFKKKKKKKKVKEITENFICLFASRTEFVALNFE